MRLWRVRKEKVSGWSWVGRRRAISEQEYLLDAIWKGKAGPRREDPRV